MEGKSQTLHMDGIENIHKLTVEDVCKTMNTRLEGLTTSEVQDKQKTYGKNVIQEKKEKSVILTFLSNFISMMAILLWVGGLVAFFAGMPSLGIAIWLVNVINGVFSFWQEYRASKAVEALKKNAAILCQGYPGQPGKTNIGCGSGAR